MAEMATAYPEDGGHYVLSSIWDGRSWRFSRLDHLWEMTPRLSRGGGLPRGAQYIAYLVPMSAIAIKLLAVASILVFMTIHVVSVEGGGKFRPS